MRFGKRLRYSIIGGLLSLCLIISGCPSLASDIALVETLATSFGSIVSVIQPQDAAAVAILNGALKAGASSIEGCYTAYKANPTAGTLADLEACGNAILASLPQTLAGLNIVNPTDSNYVSLGLNLFLDAVQAFITFAGGSVLSATLRAGAKSSQYQWHHVGKGDKKALGSALTEIKTNWNGPQFCNGMSACVVK